MVIECERPLEFLVIRNATEEEIDAVDIGKRRSGGDVLALDGYANRCSASPDSNNKIRAEPVAVNFCCQAEGIL